jgi:hypothetical protein
MTFANHYRAHFSTHPTEFITTYLATTMSDLKSAKDLAWRKPRPPMLPVISLQLLNWRKIPMFRTKHCGSMVPSRELAVSAPTMR